LAALLFLLLVLPDQLLIRPGGRQRRSGPFQGVFTMFRKVAQRASLVFLLASLLACLMATLGAQETKPVADLRSRLNQRIDFKGFDDPKTTMGEALDSLTKYGVTLDVNDNAFREEMIQDVTSCPVAEKPIPKMSNVTLETALRKVLIRVPGDATFVIRRDVIEITTEKAWEAELLHASRQNRPLPLVNMELDKKPLGEALKQLSAAADVSVVLDIRAAEAGSTPVTANFIGVPLDTAVRVLANMAGLQSARLDNMLYVTTTENAKVIQQEQKEHRPVKKKKKPEPALGFGL